MIQFIKTFKDQQYFTFYNTTFNDLDRSTRDLSRYDNEYLIKFSISEKWYLTRISFILNFYLLPYTKLYEIEWNFAKANYGIENNYPHTFKNIIVLPYNFMEKYTYDAIIRVVLHEKIHIFQRYHPIPTLHLYINHWNLYISNYGYDKDQRSNPDINPIQFGYYDPNTTNIIYNYNKYIDKPNSIRDVVLCKNILKKSLINRNVSSRIYHDLVTSDKYQTEHPNEVMACLLTDIILQNTKHNPTNTWLSLFIYK